LTEVRVFRALRRKIDIYCKDCFGETPKPTRETRALPGFGNFGLCKSRFSLDIEAVTFS